MPAGSLLNRPPRLTARLHPGENALLPLAEPEDPANPQLR